jgi:transcriptional regulator with XRE-family HTH domain
MQDYDVFVGSRIRRVRVLKDVSQEELGKVLKLPKQAISAIEKGKRKLSIEELDKISTFFNEPMQAFIKEDYEFVHIIETPFGAIPVFFDDFLEQYRYAFKNIDMYKEHGKKFTEKLIRAMEIIQKEEKK